MIWKLLQQLSELMPHLTRLVPMLERMGFGGMQPEQLSGLEKGVGDLRDSHSTLLNQMKDQNLRLAALEGKMEQLQLQSARVEEQMETIARQGRAAQLRLSLVLGFVVLLLLVVMIAAALLFVQHR